MPPVSRTARKDYLNGGGGGGATITGGGSGTTTGGGGIGSITAPLLVGTTTHPASKNDAMAMNNSFLFIQASFTDIS